MKKALFFAASLLVGANVFAQETSETWYQEDPDKTVVQSPDELVSGMYYLYAHCNQSGDEGLLINQTNDAKIAFFSYGTTVPPAGTTSANLIWQIDVTETEGEKTFTIMNVKTSTYFTLWGQGGKNAANNKARGNIEESANLADAATFHLVELPSNFIYVGNKRFQVQATNTTFSTSNDAAKTENYPFLHTNAAGGNRYCSFWELNGLGGTALHIEFIPVRENPRTVRDITVNLPELNGATMSFTVKASDNYSAEGPINYVINEHGGMRNVKMPENLIVSETNNVFDVTGEWNNALYPNQVYRMAIRPNEHEYAIRYDASTSSIITNNGGMATLNKIIPERMWFFKPVEDASEEDVYYLYNLAHPESPIHFNGTESAILSDDDHAPTALKVVLSAWANAKPQDISFKIVGGAANQYVHDYSNKLGTWTNASAATDPGSTIRLYALDDNDFSAFATYTDDEEAIAAAQADPTYENILPLVQEWDNHNIYTAVRRGNFYNNIGTAIGKYNTPDNNYAQILAHANAVLADENADADEVAAAAIALNEAVDQIDIVYPKPGEFLRFKNRSSGKYMTSTEGATANRMSMGVSEVGKARSNTIFYYYHDEETNKNYLVSFDDGRVIGNFSSKEENKDLCWKPVVKDAEAEKEYVGDDIIFQAQGVVNGFQNFVIHVADTGRHRHLYGVNEIVDCGDGIDAGYQWLIERVDWLPVPFINVDLATKGGWASIYTPVELVDESDRVDIYTAEVRGSKVIKTLVQSDKIPANTPILLDYKKIQGEADAEREGFGYVYFKVNYPTPNAVSLLADTNEEETPATGRPLDHNGIFATPKQAGMRYFTLHATDDDYFVPYSEFDEESNFVPGFKAHIAVPSDEAAEKYQIVDASSVSIENIEAENVGVKAVYDLQGRKLAAPSKGINIVNGKKVLVK